VRLRAAWLLPGLALAFRAAAQAPESLLDFEDAEEPPHMILGSVPAGSLMLTADVGWLRSGVRADIGLSGGFDLTLRLDAFLVGDLLSGQDGVSVGVRYTPSYRGLVRFAAEAGVGEVFIPQRFGVDSLFVVRGEMVGGLWLEELGLPYLRATARALGFDTASHSGWGRDAELGIGWERPVGRKIVVGVEGFLWFRAGLPNLGQWRIRVGIPL
jgi:hypothetical protein